MGGSTITYSSEITRDKRQKALEILEREGFKISPFSIVEEITYEKSGIKFLIIGECENNDTMFIFS